MKKFFLVFSLLFLFFTSSNALANTSKCELNLNNFTKYKSNLIKCLDNEDLELKKKVSKKINKLSKEKTNFLSNDFLKNEKFIVKDKLVVSDKFNNYLSSTINKNSQDIYGIHNELNNLRLQNSISDQGYDKLVDQSLGDFVNSIYNPNQSLTSSNVVAAIGIALAANVLTDSDKTPLKTINFSLSSSSSTENSGDTITLTATSTEAVSSNTVITLATTGDALNNTDYALSSTTLTISSGSTTGSITFTITDDSVYEGDETISFSAFDITGDSNYTSSSPTEDFTITENESAPTVTLTSSASSVAESGSALTLTATLSGATDEEVTVGISTSGTGTEGTDYSTISDIIITAGSTTGTASFTPTDDTIYEISETAIIAIDTVSGGGATESGTQSQTITITSEESAPTVTLTSSASSVAENGSALTLTATLSGATYEDVTVGISTSGTGTEGTDYATVSDITISAGSTTGTASFTPTDDTTFEPNETGIIAISTVSGGGATENGTQTTTITITENDSAPTVTLSSSASSIAENAGSSLTLTATLSNATTADVTVSFSYTGTGTAGGTDYANVSDIVISAGSTTGTASFTPVDDSTFEGDETAIVAIDTVSGGSATESGSQTVTITISEDDSGPSFSINDVTTSDESATTHTFTVTLSSASGVTATVDYATSDGTATAGSDYTAASGTLTFAAGQTSKTFTVAVLADSADENDETVTITLSNATQASISDSTGTLTITDDDTQAARTVTLSSSASSVAENGSALTLTATLSGTVGQDVTVTFIHNTGTATGGTDYANVSNITISAGATTGTASFTPTDDNIYEGNETAIIQINTVSAGASESGTQSETITITEDDSAPTITLSRGAASVAEPATSGASATTVTLTATASIAADEAITVTIDPSGSSTGTEGTDYTIPATITIAANATTGSGVLTPIHDTLFENSETAIITISGVSGGSASENGTQSQTIAITDKALNSGTQNTYSSSQATTWEVNEVEFTNSGFNDDIYSNTNGGDDPYKNINLHKALAYSNGSGLMLGSGEVIALMDTGFQVDGKGSNNSTHIELQGKTITTFDNSTFLTYNGTGSSAFWHGTFVAGIAAGTYGSGATMGVAPSASLHLHSFNANYQPTWWATGTTDAEGDSAVVQNNSWGFDDDSETGGVFDITNLTTYKTNNSKTAAETIVHFQGQDTDSDGNFDIGNGTSQKTWSVANWNTYADALDSFQDTGVIVWALSNNDAKTNADVSAALPELFTDLKEAWIAVANIDIEGTSSKTYTLESAPCGATAEYCLGADGHGISGPGGNDYDIDVGGVIYDYETSTGTSFATPQVSGAVALLATHFPNHSPAPLTDRLLASAYNNWAAFGVDGTTTFGNGVQHGYSTDYGHGVMDIYAALQPITSSAMGRSLFTQSNSNSNSPSQSLSLDRSYVSVSRSFGDAIQNALSGEVNYFYDAMGGGFEYKMESHIVPQSKTKSFMNIEAEVNTLTRASTLNNHININKNDYQNILSKKSFSDDENIIKDLALTFGGSSLPVQSFFNSEQMALNSITDYNLPFLSTEDNGMSLNSLIDMGKYRFSLSTTTPIKENQEGGEVYMGDYSSFMSTFEYNFNDSLTFGLLSGLVEEREGFLGLDGNEAFSLKNSDNLSKFNSLKLQKNITNDLALTLTGTYAYSDFVGDKSSLLKSANDILSESYSITLNKAHLFGNDNFAISISQPNRVKEGYLTLRLSDLADKDGNINIRETDVNLEPSGRQTDTSFAYTKDLSDTLSLSLKGTITDELDHIKDNGTSYSAFVGLNLEHLKMGISNGTNSSKPDFRLNYKKAF